MTKIQTQYYLKDDPTWVRYEGADALIDYINPVDGYELNKRSVDVSSKKLSFFEDLEIIRVYGDKWVEKPEDEVCFFFVKKGDEIIFLNGTSDNIYEANDLGGLKLNEETCVEYLKFFCMFTVGDDEGNSFYIIDGPDSEFIYFYSQYEKDRKLKNYDGIKVVNKNGGFVIDARTTYGPDTYDAKYEVAPDGSVVMLDDEAL